MSIHSVVEVLFGIIPILDRIKQSIEKSTGTIPRASVQLSSVTQATEMATVEILNVLERMTERIGSAETAVQTMRVNNGNAAASLDTIGQALADTRQDAMNIAMALQVQDITSQQIAGVTHMIENVRSELLVALGQLELSQRGELRKTSAQSSTTFDTNASYTGASQRQENADSIIQQWKKMDHE